MRHLLATVLLGSGLLAGVLSAQTQYDGRYDRRYDGRYNDRGRVEGDYGRYGGDRYRGGDVFDRLRRDLDRAESHSYGRGSDHRRFNKVRQEMGEFQNKWARGRFDRHELDDVIGALKRVVNDNRIDPRDRDALANDMYQLREFRAANQRYR